MKTSKILLLAALALVLVGITTLLITFKITTLNNCIEAQGALVEREFKTDSFSGITINSKFDVEITQDTLQKVTIRAEENLIDNFSVVVKDGQLKVSRIYCMKKNRNTLVKISVDTLAQLKVQTGGKIKSTNTIKGENIEMEISSGGSAEMKLAYSSIVCNLSAGAMGILEGYANSFKSDMNSGSTLKAGKLVTKTCNLSANSGAMAEVNVTDQLTVEASSGANVHYRGNPVKKNIDAHSGANVNGLDD